MALRCLPPWKLPDQKLRVISHHSPLARHYCPELQKNWRVFPPLDPGKLTIRTLNKWRFGRWFSSWTGVIFSGFPCYHPFSPLALKKDCFGQKGQPMSSGLISNVRGDSTRGVGGWRVGVDTVDGYSTNPRVRPPNLLEIAGLMIRAYENHSFPLNEAGY